MYPSDTSMSLMATCIHNMSRSDTGILRIHPCCRRRHVSATCRAGIHVSFGYIHVADDDMYPPHVVLRYMYPFQVASGRRRRLLLATSCQRFKLLNLWQQVSRLSSRRLYQWRGSEVGGTSVKGH